MISLALLLYDYHNSYMLFSESETFSVKIGVNFFLGPPPPVYRGCLKLGGNVPSNNKDCQIKEVSDDDVMAAQVRNPFHEIFIKP